MKDFALDDSGDVIIEFGDIALIHGEQQAIQKIRQVLGTRLGEWIYDEHEGIDFTAFLQKQSDMQRIRETIQNALHTIDERYILQDCSYTMDSHSLKVQISVENQMLSEIYIPIKTTS